MIAPAEPTTTASLVESPGDSRFLTYLDHKLRSRGGVRLVKSLHVALTLSAIGFLGVRVWRTGPDVVISALPVSPAYYALFCASYILLPLSEMLLYGRLLAGPLGLAPFLRKRAYNEAILDYTGEGYLFGYLRKRSPKRGREVASIIKDVNLLSGVVSNSATVLLLVAMIVAGRQSMLAGPNETYPLVMVTSAAIVTLLLVGMAIFHRHLIKVSARQSHIILAVHGLRLALVLSLQIAQWHCVIPGVQLSRWVLFLTIWLLVTRIPFLPNRDLVLAGVGVTLGGLIAAPASAVTGLFVAGAMLPLLAHAVVLLMVRDQRTVTQPSP